MPSGVCYLKPLHVCDHFLCKETVIGEEANSTGMFVQTRIGTGNSSVCKDRDILNRMVYVFEVSRTHSEVNYVFRNIDHNRNRVYYTLAFSAERISPASCRTRCGLSGLSSRIFNVVSPLRTRMPVMPALRPDFTSV